MEVNKTNIYGDNSQKWVYHTKGGEYRKWSGNRTDLLNYEYKGKELHSFNGSSLTGEEQYFEICITYNRISSSKTSFRYAGKNSIPNMAGLSLYPRNNENLLYLLGWLNTNIICEILSIINPTLNFLPGAIGKLPMKTNIPSKELVNNLVSENVNLSQCDWDSFETSWDFMKHPLL